MAAGRARFPKKAEALRACPFCRELFVEDEGDTCPECGVALRDLASLPPSPDAEVLVHEEVGGRPLQHTVPQAEDLPWHDLSRGRGLLVACALFGMAAFYLPWAVQTAPHDVTYTARELATKQSFFWSAFTAWLVLVPAVLSRRSILSMVGSRLIVTVMCALPAVWCGFLLTRPSKLLVKGVPFEYHWGVGFWATVALSVVATLIALRFGGRLDDVKVKHGSSTGEVLH